MNYCPECGESIGKKDTFCSNCGTQLRKKGNQNHSSQKQGNLSEISETLGEERGETAIFRILGGFSVSIAIAGLFLDWVAFEFLSVLDENVVATAMGVEFNLGILVLAMAIVSLFLFIPKSPASHLFASVLGLAITAAMLGFINDPMMFEVNLSDFESAALSEVSEIKIGAYVTLIGSIWVVLFGIFSAVVESR